MHRCCIRMLLLLQGSPEQELALQQLLSDQQSKSSGRYQGWLTPQQFGAQFGPSDADVQTVTQWLMSQGFTNIVVGAGRTAIEFSGSAGQVRNAFHTEMRRYATASTGEAHFANASDPAIPAALAPVVAGIVSLNNFPIQSHLKMLGTFQKSLKTGETRPLFTFGGCPGGNCYGVAPADFALIYNTQPLLSGSPKIDGTGQGIAIVGESNIRVQDVTDFRTMFGLAQNFSSANVIWSRKIQEPMTRRVSLISRRWSMIRRRVCAWSADRFRRVSYHDGDFSGNQSVGPVYRRSQSRCGDGGFG